MARRRYWVHLRTPPICGASATAAAPAGRAPVTVRAPPLAMPTAAGQDPFAAGNGQCVLAAVYLPAMLEPTEDVDDVFPGRVLDASVLGKEDLSQEVIRQGGVPRGSAGLRYVSERDRLVAADRGEPAGDVERACAEVAVDRSAGFRRRWGRGSRWRARGGR